MSCQPVPTTRNISVNDHTLKTTKATAVTPKATNCGALVGERIQTRGTIPGAKRKTPVNVTRMPHEVRRVLFATKLFTSVEESMTTIKLLDHIMAAPDHIDAAQIDHTI